MSDYLWDRSKPVDPEVAALEAQLKPLAFDASKHPISIPPRRRTFSLVAIGLAASIALIAGTAAFHTWRLRWDADRPWSIDGGGAFAIGTPLRVGATAAKVDIARLGVMRAEPGTDLALNDTSSTRHRFTLTRGNIDVRVWAPPGRVAVHTPAGDVIDLGCMFRLSVDSAAVTHLSVQTGWVELENARGSSAIPAGASASMSADRAPGVPVYDDASAAFRDAVRTIESRAGDAAGEAVRTVALDARPRDAITVLMLSRIDHLPYDVHTALLETAQRLHEPPSPDAVARIMAGDDDPFWRWFDALPLPPMKNWWANWRDLFPR